MSASRWAIFADFDGTLTDHDTIDLLAEEYLGRAYWREMERRFAAGGITVRDWLDDEFGRLGAAPEAIEALLRERVRVDEGLAELTAFAGARDIPLVILSSGMDRLILPLLRAAGCAAEVRCNRLIWEAEARRYRVEYRDGSDNGHDKAAALRAARAEGRRVVFLGDGVTDLACAAEADVIFAHRTLAEHCRRRGIAFHPLRGCRDVLRWLEKELAQPEAPTMSAPAGQICPACSTNNLLHARKCEVCGAPLAGVPPQAPPRTVHGESERDLELAYVPHELREAVRNFDDEAEAELAAGLLRANGIAAEVGKMMIPGLQFEMALWVRRADAGAARQLLDETEAAAKGPRAVED